MNDEELKKLVNKVVETAEGFQLFEYLIFQSGCLDRSINFDNTLKQYYICGKKDFGTYILDLIKTSNFDKYTKMIRKD